MAQMAETSIFSDVGSIDEFDGQISEIDLLNNEESSPFKQFPIDKIKWKEQNLPGGRNDVIKQLEHLRNRSHGETFSVELTVHEHDPSIFCLEYTRQEEGRVIFFKAKSREDARHWIQILCKLYGLPEQFPRNRCESESAVKGKLTSRQSNDIRKSAPPSGFTAPAQENKRPTTKGTKPKQSGDNRKNPSNIQPVEEVCLEDDSEGNYPREYNPETGRIEEAEAKLSPEESSSNGLPTGQVLTVEGDNGVDKPVVGIPNLKDKASWLRYERDERKGIVLEVDKTILDQMNTIFCELNDKVYISDFIRYGENIFYRGDCISCVNKQVVHTKKEVIWCIKSTDGNKVSFKLRRFPHGHQFTIDTEGKDLGIELQGNEITHMDPDGCLRLCCDPAWAKCITDSEDSTTNFCITAINDRLVPYNSNEKQVNGMIEEARDKGSRIHLQLHPSDFTKALAIPSAVARESTLINVDIERIGKPQSTRVQRRRSSAKEPLIVSVTQHADPS